MKILVAKTFGIGNAVMAVPMIKALQSQGHDVFVLIGSSNDDFGAGNILRHVVGSDRIVIDCSTSQGFGNLGFVPVDISTSKFIAEPPDCVILSIPYDGRWEFLRELFPKAIFLDGRTRPGQYPNDKQVLGFQMWMKHEIEYQIENAVGLGFNGETPGTSFLTDGREGFHKQPIDPNAVYLGIGHKRDAGGFGASKHFGTERFAALMVAIRKFRPYTTFHGTGGVADMFEAMRIYRELQDTSFYSHKALNLEKSFETLSGCAAYIGNDTGMMHVAASLGMPTYGLFAYPELVVKNPPFCAMSRCLVFAPDCPPIERIAEDFCNFAWGT